MIGGLVALRFKDKLHLILGFSAGAIIAVAFFDLMPEALELGGKHFNSASVVTSVVALGFLTYLVLDRLIFLHAHAHEDASEEAHGESHEHEPSDSEAHFTCRQSESFSNLRRSSHSNGQHPTGARGILGASSLSFHSFLDGVAIGLAFQVSTAVGAIVAVAVLVHDFSDGINTVNLILKNQKLGARSSSSSSSLRLSESNDLRLSEPNGLELGDKNVDPKTGSRLALKFLIVDALAPIVGVASTLFFTLPESALAIILALFSGFFLYIGATDLIPESHHAHPKFLTTAMTLLGAGILYMAIHFANV
jgi:ZIP family zinc transporter